MKVNFLNPFSPLYCETKKRCLYFQLLLIFVLLLITGFSREWTFFKLNSMLGNIQGTGALSHPFSEELFKNNFYLMKWFFTALFSAVYLVFACWTVYLLFGNKQYLKITVFFHVLLEVLAIISIITGKVLQNDMMGYRLARDFMGLAQSPLIVMILIPAFYLMKSGLRKVSEEKN